MKQEAIERLMTLCFSGVGVTMIRCLFLGRLRYRIRKGIRWMMTIGLVVGIWFLFHYFW